MMVRCYGRDAIAQGFAVSAQRSTELTPKSERGSGKANRTGEPVTQLFDASGVGCLNLANRQWDTDILNALNLSPALFPSVLESTAIARRLKSDIAAHVGLHWDRKS